MDMIDIEVGNCPVVCLVGYDVSVTVQSEDRTEARRQRRVVNRLEFLPAVLAESGPVAAVVVAATTSAAAAVMAAAAPDVVTAVTGVVAMAVPGAASEKVAATTTAVVGVAARAVAPAWPPVAAVGG